MQASERQGGNTGQNVKHSRPESQPGESLTPGQKSQPGESLTPGQKVDPGNTSLLARMSKRESLGQDSKGTSKGTAEGLSPLEPKWALRTQDPVQAQ